MADPYRWLTAYRMRDRGQVERTQTASYSLRGVAERGYLARGEVNSLLMDAGLVDLTWRMVWGEDYETPDDEIDDRVLGAEGYVVFIHGWTGTHAIWEDMPSQVVARNRKLVALVADVNGFGESAFVDPMPPHEQCNPVAVMKVVERWLELLKLRRQPGDPHLKAFTFVGHSMGGAALFFLDEATWRRGEQARLALAPALLLEDEANRTFFTALGLGIGLVGRIRLLEAVDDLVSPSVLDALAEGATDFVREEHDRVYRTTPKSVTARVLAAMGVIREHPKSHDWDLMEVVLGHKDRLVQLIPMLNLLDELGFNVHQIHVVLGTHYLFSTGETHHRTHSQNKALILRHILRLHEEAMLRQRKG